MIKFNVASIITCTEVEGPFRRAAIWFQGCDVHCQGCCNPDYQKMKVAHILGMDELLQIILKSKKENAIEGVTFCGGEPTLQVGLASLAKSLRNHGLGTIMFTGHLVESLDDDLVKSIDMIIDGPYIHTESETERKLIGSRNQRIIHVSPRYVESSSWFLNKTGFIDEINLSCGIVINGDAL